MSREVAALDQEELAKVSRLFEALDAAGRHALLGAAKDRQCSAGEVICREGEHGDEFYVVSSGEVRVTADDMGTERELAILGAGTFFGEIAALSGKPRAATVTAVGALALIVFPFTAVRAVLRDHPKAREVLTRAGVQRAEETLQKMLEQE
jgi:CRP-like cAMP-binding protein